MNNLKLTRENRVTPSTCAGAFLCINILPRHFSCVHCYQRCCTHTLKLHLFSATCFICFLLPVLCSFFFLFCFKPIFSSVIFVCSFSFFFQWRAIPMALSLLILPNPEPVLSVPGSCLQTRLLRLNLVQAPRSAGSTAWRGKTPPLSRITLATRGSKKGKNSTTIRIRNPQTEQALFFLLSRNREVAGSSETTPMAMA